LENVQAQAELATKTYQRGAVLYQEGVISRQRRDEMYAAQQSAKALSEATYQQYARAKRGSTPEQKSMADAQVEIAQAALAEATHLKAKPNCIHLSMELFLKLTANHPSWSRPLYPWLVFWKMMNFG
jgi:hypothetical protein